MYGYRVASLRAARKLEALLYAEMQARGHTVLNRNIPRAWKQFHPEVSRQLYHRRLQLGWTDHAARTTPPKKYSRRR